MRIGQFAHFGLGGASKVIEVLSKGLREVDPNLEVIVFYNKASLPRPGEMSRFDNYAGFQLVQIDDFRRLNDFGLDVLNTHRGGDDAWAFSNFDQLQYNFKIVETNFHGIFNSKKDFTVFPSRTMIRERVPFPHRVIYNPTFPPATVLDLIEELPQLCGKFVYGRISRPDRDVFSPVNLEAYKLIEGYDTAFLYVAPHADAVAAAKRLDIKNVVFLPPTTDEERLSKIYNTFDVLCHSNPIGETFGNTVAEAMIHGLPVVSHLGSSNWPQAQVELLGTKKSFCVPNGDIAKYAELMQLLNDDEATYDHCSKYLMQRAQLFHYHNVARQYLEVYKSLL